jgi:hypothetical protein
MALGDITTITLSRVGGAGSIVVNVQPLGGVPKTNTVVRAWNTNDSTFSNPGYSLYDSDNVKYWKYLGWDEPEQRYVTRHQLNQVVETSAPIFDNINNMLRQFNGVLRFSNGLYALDIKTAAPSVFTAGIDSISEDDIIGSIALQDKGQKDSYNSITTNIVDPQNKFATRDVSFFNSTYLKQDRGVPKQGTYALPGISNYYNARLNIMQYLNESRYGLTISFKMDQKGYLLLPGEIIALNYKRFNWVNKLFRITDLTLEPDGIISIVADEHNDAAYLIDYIDRDHSYYPGTGGNLIQPIAPPINLAASQDLDGAIQLTWTNSVDYDPTTYNIEVYAAQAAKNSLGDYILDSNSDPTGNEFVNATLLDVTYGVTYVHNGLGEVTGNNFEHIWYYWIRYVKKPLNPRETIKFSPYEPTELGMGVEGRATDALADDGRVVTLTASRLSWAYDDNGNLIEALPAAQATVTATPFNNVYTPYYQFFVYNVNGILVLTSPANPTTSDTYMYSPPLTIGEDLADPRWMPETIKVEMREGAFDAPLQAIDSILMSGLQNATNALTVNLSNPTHLVSVPNTGIPIYTGSGTTIEVFEGTTVLTAVATVDLDPGQFKVAVDSALNINATTSIVPNSAGTLMVIGDHSGMTADQAHITYDVTIQRASGAEEVYNVTQYFTKVKDGAGQISTLLASDHSVVYDAFGLNPTFNGVGGKIQLTATSQGYIVPYYRLVQDGAFGSWFQSNSLLEYVFEYTPSPTYTIGTTVFELETKEGSGGDPSSADTLSIIFVKEGTGGLAGILTNENHTVTANSAGGGYSLATAGGSFEVFSGGTDVTLSSVFDVGNSGVGMATSSGLKFTINQTTGVYTLSDNPAWTSNAETFNVTATYDGQVITKIYSISKALEGTDGRVASIIADDYTVIYNDQGTVPVPTGPITITLSGTGFLSPEYSFESELANITGASVFPNYSSDNVASFTVPATYAGWTGPCLVYGRVREVGAGVPVVMDTLSIQPISGAINAITVQMTNPSQSLSEVGGVILYDGSDNTISVYEGATQLDFTTVGLNGTIGSNVNKWRIASRTYGGGLTGTFTAPTIIASGLNAYINELDYSDATPWTDFAKYSAYCDYVLHVQRLNQSGADYVAITVRQTFQRNVVAADGSDTYSISLSNASHVIRTDPPDDPGGAYDDAYWPGSGTTITVLKGGVPIAYNAAGTVANTWRITTDDVIDGSGITISTPSNNGTIVTYPSHNSGSTTTAWASATGKIQYTIYIKDPANALLGPFYGYQNFTRVPTGSQGDPGIDGVVDHIDLPVAAVICDSTGQNYSINNGGYINNPSTGQSFVGMHRVFDAGVEITDQCTHSLPDGVNHPTNPNYMTQTKSGVTIYYAKAYQQAELPEGSWFYYSVGGSAWTTNHETFKIRAVTPAGTVFDQVVAIMKLPSGEPAPQPPTSTTGNVKILNRLISQVVAASGTATVRYILTTGTTSTAYEQGYRNGTTTTYGNWLLSGAAGDFQVRYQKLSGATITYSNTSEGAWTTMTSTTYVQLQRATVGVSTAQIRVTIRLSAPPNTELVQATIELEAESYSGNIP